MRRFSITTAITADPDRVWQIMRDIDRWHEWTASISSVTRLGDAPFAIGMRALVRQPKLPPARWTITEIVPGRSFTWVSVSPGVRVIGRHSIEKMTGGSEVTLSIELQGIFGGLVGRMTRDITTRYLRLEAAGLKARSETSSALR